MCYPGQDSLAGQNRFFIPGLWDLFRLSQSYRSRSRAMPGCEKSLRASFFKLEPRPNPPLPTTHSSFLCHAREALPPSDLPKHTHTLCAQAACVLGTSPWRRRSSRAFAALGGVTGPFPPPRYGHARDARCNSPRPMRLSEWVGWWVVLLCKP